MPKAMRALRRNLKPYLALPADQFSKADLRNVRDAMVEAGTVIAANRLLGCARSDAALGGGGRSGCRSTSSPPSAARRRTSAARADQGGDQGDLESLRRSRHPRGGEELRPHGAGSCCSRRSGATRRPRFAMVTSSTASGGRPRTRRAGRTASRCRRWRWPWSGRARRGTTCSPAAAASSRGFSTLKARARQGVRRHRVAAARFAQNRGDRHAGAWRSATRWCRRFSITRCPASVASICEPNSRSEKAEALATWAAALTKIVGPSRSDGHEGRRRGKIARTTGTGSVSPC